MKKKEKKERESWGKKMKKCKKERGEKHCGLLL